MQNYGTRTPYEQKPVLEFSVFSNSHKSRTNSSYKNVVYMLLQML